jgi:hypothetical protein
MRLGKAFAVITLTVPLLLLLASSFPMLLHSQALGRCALSSDTFAPVVHEAGLARLAISVLGATLIYGCVRLDSWSSWAGLVLFFGIYFMPAFGFYPLSNVFGQGPRSIFEGLPGSRIAQHNILTVVSALSFLAGLYLAVPKRAQGTTGRRVL